MNEDKKLLDTITAINAITNQPRLKFDEKLQQTLFEVLNCIGVKKGSVMLLKGAKNMVVIASTNPDIIGFKQSIDHPAPSSWVVKHRTPLYFDGSMDGNEFMSGRFDHYVKDAFLIAPIRIKKRVLGVITVTEKIGADQFTKEEQSMLLTLVEHLISLLENERLNESLRKSKRQLKQKNHDLKNLEKIRSELFHMLTHDFKSLISEVLTRLDILSYTVTHDHLEYVEAAHTICDTLYRMVTNLLDIEQMEEGSLILHEETINAADIIKESLSRIHGIAKIKDLHLPEDHLKSQNNDCFYGDRAILMRVIQNLLINAVHHSPHGETIAAGFEHIEENRIRFYVQDNGPGIAPQYQEKIFDKYAQIRKTEKERSYAAGLGLTFCKLAVAAHGGTISVKSDGKLGSCFFVTLPTDN